MEAGLPHTRPTSRMPSRKVDTASGDTDLTPHVTLSFTAGCAESEVHRLFCAGVSGFPLGKDGENRGEGLCVSLVGGSPASLLRSLLPVSALPQHCIPAMFPTVSDSGFPRALPGTAPRQRQPPCPAGLHLPPPRVRHQHSLLHPLDPPPLRARPVNVTVPRIMGVCKIVHLKQD